MIIATYLTGSFYLVLKKYESWIRSNNILTRSLS